MGAVTNGPMIIDLYHNPDFIFNNPYVFKDRFAGGEGYFSAEGRTHPGRIGVESEMAPFFGGR